MTISVMNHRTGKKFEFETEDVDIGLHGTNGVSINVWGVDADTFESLPGDVSSNKGTTWKDYCNRDNEGNIDARFTFWLEN